MRNNIRIGHSDYYIIRKDSKARVIRASAVGETEVVVYNFKTGLEKGIAYMYISDTDEYVTFMSWLYEELTGVNAEVNMSIIKDYKIRNKRLTDDTMIDLIDKMNGARLGC